MTQTNLIYQKIPAIMSDLEAIGKDKRNQSQGFSYRGIDDFYNMLHPLLAKHRVFTVPKMIKETRETRTNTKGTVLTYVQIQMEYTFFAEDGSSVVASTLGEGMDSGDKASNKAMAIAHKYALMQIFAVPTEDLVDPDHESHETVAPKPPQPRAASIDDGRAIMRETLGELSQAMTRSEWGRDNAAKYVMKRWSAENATMLTEFQAREFMNVLRFKKFDQAFAELENKK